MKTQCLALLSLVAVALFLTSPLHAQAPAPAGVKALRDLAYVDGGVEHQKLDLYVPEKAGGPWPLLIWIHGGAFSAGDKAGCPALKDDRAGLRLAIRGLPSAALLSIWPVSDRLLG